jgi:nicotinate-nucleotide adenylyltransferase
MPARLGELGERLSDQEPAAARRIGLFGGSFDPVHRAHLAFAHAALVALALDELRWLPAGQPWQKTRTITAAAHREAMLRLAIEGEPRFVLDRRELERAGASYTLDSVRELQAERPAARCFLLIGQDQYAGLHTWHGWRELLARVTLAVAQRPGAPLAADPEVQRAAVQAVPLPAMDVSSTQIRARVAAGRSIVDLVPDNVARYIELNRLYRGEPGS